MESLTCACPSRHLQQPVHGGGQEQSEAEPQHWWRRADCGGADPWTRGVLWPDTGSAQRCVVLNSYSFILVRFGCFLTPLFAAGYWPSYNIPFHRKIYELSGYTEMWQQYGDDFSYDLCPRAKIFRRDQASVIDLGSLKHIMRFNGEGLSLCLVSQWTNSLKHNRIFVSWLTQLLFLDQLPLPGAGWSFACSSNVFVCLFSDYKKDPYSKGDPCKSICCRGDLRSEGPTPEGCYDTKVRRYPVEREQWWSELKGEWREDSLQTSYSVF